MVIVEYARLVDYNHYDRPVSKRNWFCFFYYFRLISQFAASSLIIIENEKREEKKIELYSMSFEQRMIKFNQMETIHILPV